MDTRYLNYDRGNKKWTSLMIPEHVEMLRQFANEEYYKTPKPIIDEYQLQEFEEKIHYAMEYHYLTVLKVWYEGFTEEVRGYIHYLDPIQKEIRFKDNKGNIERVKFQNVINVEVEDT